MTPSPWWKRISAAVSALAIGAVSAVATAPPAAADDWSPSISVSKTIDLDPAGETITVNGSGFDPNANISTRPPVPVGEPTGVYVVFGNFLDNWRPSQGVPAGARKVISQKWAIPNPTSGDPYVPLNSDGTFTTEIGVKTIADGLDDGIYGIYVYAAGGAVNAEQELMQVVTFADDSGGPGDDGDDEPDDGTPPATPSRTTNVSVTSATASSGLTLSISGSGYTDLPKASTGAPAMGVYAALRDPATMSNDAINADNGIVAAVAYVPTIIDGGWSTTLAAPTAKLNKNAHYEVIVWVAHGNITGSTLLATIPVPLSAGQLAALFGDDSTGGDTTPADEQPTAMIEGENSVEHGETITFTGTGFEPGELVNGTVHSDPVSLGSENADEKGIVTFTWNVPAGFEVGEHHLELVGQTSGRTATVPFTIAAPAKETPESSTTKKPSTTTKPAADDDPVCTEENIPARAGTSSLSWGVKSSFASYVEGGIANGTITVSSGAARSGGGFTWGTGAGSLKANGTGTLAFPGSVRFTGHDGVLDTTISNLRVAITSSTSGTLTATVRSQDMSGKTTASGPVTLADLTFSSLSAAKGTATVTLAAAGAAAFAGFYEAGEALDPLTVTVTAATAATTRTVCHNAGGDLVDADGNVIEETVGGLASTGVRGVGTMAGLAALLIVGGGALLMRERRTRAVHR